MSKQYASSFRLKQRAATYCLAPAGIRYLKYAGHDRTQLHYKNKDFTEQQIDEQLLLGHLARAVHEPYRDQFSSWTKYEQDEDRFLITPAPFLKLEGKDDTIPDYFMEYFPAYTESWKIRRRINEHSGKAGDYEYIYPYLLLVAGNDSTERRIVNMTDRLIADFGVLTTTKERLLTGAIAIWLKPYEVDREEKLEFYELPLAYEE